MDLMTFEQGFSSSPTGEAMFSSLKLYLSRGKHALGPFEYLTAII